MDKDRQQELLERETKAWDHVIDSLGGKGRVPIRYLINAPQIPTKDTPRSIK